MGKMIKLAPFFFFFFWVKNKILGNIWRLDKYEREKQSPYCKSANFEANLLNMIKSKTNSFGNRFADSLLENRTKMEIFSCNRNQSLQPQNCILKKQIKNMLHIN